MTKSVDLSSVEGCQKVLDALALEGEEIKDNEALLIFVSGLPSALSSLQSNSSKEEKKRVQKVVHGFCEKAFKLLQEDYSQLPEDALSALLGGISRNSSLFSEYPVLRKNLIKVLVGIWSSAASDSSRLASFLSLHALCKRYSKLLDTALKSMYQHYCNACRSLSSHNLGQASLMLNGLVEIYSLSPAKSIEFGTRYLRQMASTLQTAIKRPERNHLKNVLCWQYISILRFWTQLLVRNASLARTGKMGSNPMKELIFPVCSMINILMSFQPSPRYFGFHFHCIAAAIDISSALKISIPVAAPLIRIIGYVAKQPLYKMETKKAAYDLVATIKVPKSEVATKGYLESIAVEALFYLIAWATKHVDAAFPEHILPTIAALKDMMTLTNGMDRNLKKQIEGHLVMLAQQKKEIEAWRVAEGLTPLKLKEMPEAVAIPMEKNYLAEYFSNLEKVRLMRKKILADRQAGRDEDENSDADSGLAKPKKMKEAKRLAAPSKEESEASSDEGLEDILDSEGPEDDISDIGTAEDESSEGEIPAKKSAVATFAKASNRKKSPEERLKHPSKKLKKQVIEDDNEEDIVEDFVI